MQTYDVFTQVRVRVRAKNHNKAENRVLDLLESKLGKLLNKGDVTEAGIAMSSENPRSYAVGDAGAATHRLCTDMEGGEHNGVRATDQQLIDLGLYLLSHLRYDDGVPTWQGTRDAVAQAYSLYGVEN